MAYTKLECFARSSATVAPGTREEDNAHEREQLESALAYRSRRAVLQPLVLVHAHPDPPGEAFDDSLTARVYWPRPWGAIVQNVHVPEGPVELLRALIRFDTSNPPGNERPCIEFIGALLEQSGIEHRYIALEDDRPNLVARVRGRGAAPPLLLYGHVDVVPADPNAWAHAPFGGDLVDGEVWGRGARHEAASRCS
jgi:hypothetical protein